MSPLSILSLHRPLRTCLGTLALLVAAAGGLAHAGGWQEDWDNCKKQIVEVAEPKNGYLCYTGDGDASACHQTATRVAPIFLGADKSPPKATSIGSFDAAYDKICGHPFPKEDQGQKSKQEPKKQVLCVPQESAFYQLFINDDDSEQGHSFAVACIKEHGCAILQGVAGAFGLRHWIGQADKTVLSKNSTSNTGLLPVAREHYGKLQLLSGTVLQEWLEGLHQMSVAKGKLKSVAVFWTCDQSYYRCERLKQVDPQNLQGTEFADPVWDQSWSKSSSSGSSLPKTSDNVIGYRYPWDGKCREFAAVRKAGATYKSIYCSSDKALTGILKQKINGLTEREGMCIMGLTEAGGLPLMEPGRCDSRGPRDETTRFRGKQKGKVIAVGRIQVEPKELRDDEDMPAPARLMFCIAEHEGKSYEFGRSSGNEFTGPDLPGSKVGTMLDVECRIAGPAGKEVIQAKGLVPTKGQLALTLPEIKLLGLIADAQTPYSAGGDFSDPKPARRRKINALARRLGVTGLDLEKDKDDQGKWTDLEGSVLKEAKKQDLYPPKGK